LNKAPPKEEGKKDAEAEVKKTTEEAKKDEAEWKQEEKKAATTTAATTVGNIVKEEEKEEAGPAKTWGAVKESSGQAKAGAKYVARYEPGNKTAASYPTLGSRLADTNIKIGTGGNARAKVSSRTNAFAALNEDGDSGNEGETVIKAAYVRKEKGKTMEETITNRVKEVREDMGIEEQPQSEEEDESKKKERLVKERLKEEKKRVAAEKRAQIKESMRAEKRGEPAPAATGPHCDSSKFSYASFNPELARGKYFYFDENKDRERLAVERRESIPIPVAN